MKSRIFGVFVLLTAACAAVCAAEEKTLPLPESGQVTLTLDEYDKLIELASKPPKKPDAAPLPYSIKHAGVKLRVDNDRILGTVELDGEVFRKGLNKVR